MTDKARETFVVSITEQYVPGAWYDRMRGQKFECVMWGNLITLYEDIQKGDKAMWRHIDKEHCTVVAKRLRF